MAATFMVEVECRCDTCHSVARIPKESWDLRAFEDDCAAHVRSAFADDGWIIDKDGTVTCPACQQGVE